jgi:hypothetical protein
MNRYNLISLLFQLNLHHRTTRELWISNIKLQSFKSLSHSLFTLNYKANYFHKHSNLRLLPFSRHLPRLSRCKLSPSPHFSHPLTRYTKFIIMFDGPNRWENVQHSNDSSDLNNYLPPSEIQNNLNIVSLPPTISIADFLPSQSFVT